jgi:hypothetical protein
MLIDHRFKLSRYPINLSDHSHDLIDVILKKLEPLLYLAFGFQAVFYTSNVNIMTKLSSFPSKYLLFFVMSEAH